ncbi:MAG TPA: aminotransferase [Verrucomicrobiae bacterium]|jgi:putrescine aminotransferase
MEKSLLGELRESDRSFHLHPFTNHAELHAEGTHVITSGRGVFLRDEQGRELLDALAGLWCVNVGYNCREIIEAVRAQMERLPYYPSFFNTSTEPSIRLAARLAKLAPPRVRHTMFCNSGSEANETALKLIRFYNRALGRPQKTKIITRVYAYHGVTLATASMTGLPTGHGPFNLPLPGFLHAPAPHAYAANTDLDPVSYGEWCVEETERMIEREGTDTVAAMFIEPIQGAGGVIIPPPGYLKALRELCRERDILFVADEVITGFGRLGDWLASDLWQLDPDVIVLAKGITSGYFPLGATMVSDEIADVLLKGGYLGHGFTYSGHPVATAAAMANLDVIEQRGLIARVRDDVGPYFMEKLLAFRGHPAVGEARGFGLIGALELLPRGGKAALKPDLLLGAKAAKIAREEGIIVRGIRDIIAMSPPFIITREELDQMFAAVARTLDRLWD